MQLLTPRQVSIAAMWRKILIIHLLLVLALLPVAQAIGPLAGTGDADTSSHDLVLMDCGQIDPDHCVDFGNCASGSHISCDSKSKTSLHIPVSVKNSSGNIYTARAVDRYSSHLTELLLRPPKYT